MIDDAKLPTNVIILRQLTESQSFRWIVERRHLIDAAYEIEQLHYKLIDTRNEVASVLMLMDGLAEVWGDEGVFRTCRDRLRKLVPADGKDTGA